MRLTVLGSGTMVPTARRFPAAYVLEHGEQRVLLDCGFLTIARLLERSVDLQSITAVALTHFHTDHFGHLLPLVHARWVDDVHRQRPHRPLTLFGPPTLRERWQKLREVSWPEPTEDYPLTFHEGPVTEQLGALTVQSFPVRHVEWFESVGYRLTAARRSVVYTGDLHGEQSDEFLLAIQGADLLLTEAGTITKATTHLTPEEAVALAERCGVRHVLLTHVRDDHLPAIERVVAEHPTLLRLAEDGLTVEL